MWDGETEVKNYSHRWRAPRRGTDRPGDPGAPERGIGLGVRTQGRPPGGSLAFRKAEPLLLRKRRVSQHFKWSANRMPVTLSVGFLNSEGVFER